MEVFFNHSAKLVYGVRLTPAEHNAIIEFPNDKWNNLLTKQLLHTTDLYHGYDPYETIIGVCIDSIESGESTEVCVSTPTGEAVDEMLDALDSIGVDREPVWHLLCEVS